MKTAFLALTLTILSVQLAQADTNFGHWSIGTTTNKAMAYAATANDDGAIFGEYCGFSSKKCSWEIGIDMACTKGADYPVLANTDKGAINLTLLCVGPMPGGILYEYIFKNWKDLENVAKSGSMIGIAAPLQADQFKVYRFVLDGLNQSTNSLESSFFASVGNASGKNTKPVLSTQSEIL